MNRADCGHTDAELVASVAASRGCSEFDVFKAAHRAWFERPIAERELERFFVRYLFHQQVPYWLRHYLRNTRPDPLSNSSLRGFYPYLPVACTWLTGAGKLLSRQLRSGATLIA